MEAAILAVCGKVTASKQKKTVDLAIVDLDFMYFSSAGGFAGTWSPWLTMSWTKCSVTLLRRRRSPPNAKRLPQSDTVISDTTYLRAALPLSVRKGFVFPGTIQLTGAALHVSHFPSLTEEVLPNCRFFGIIGVVVYTALAVIH